MLSVCNAIGQQTNGHMNGGGVPKVFRPKYDLLLDKGPMQNSIFSSKEDILFKIKNC